MAERWFAAKREEGVFPSQAVRLRGQPEEGFATIKGAVDWLEEQGLIARVWDPVDRRQRWGPTWGRPYCATLGSRDDPWEDEDA